MEKVSVIIPLYNCEKYIIKCINSVLKQEYENLEIIVIDDASTDKSVKKVKSIKDDRIRLIKLKHNKGAAVARNKGVELATGDYICFLDADDYWKKDKLKKQLDFMKKNNYAFSYGAYAYLKNGKKKKAKIPMSINYNQLLKNHAIFTSTVMVDMKQVSKELLKMPNIKRGQDMYTWWQVLKSGITAYGLPDLLAFYRVGEKSLSNNKFKAIRRTWRLFQMEDISFIKKVYCFICYILNAIKRRI